LNAGCFPNAREAARDPAELLRAAVDNTLALKSVRVTEETAFPSSEELLSAEEAKRLGTGIWTRIVEFVAPDRVHYSSSSEDGGLEAYRVGSSIAYRLMELEAPDGDRNQEGDGRWIRVGSVADVSDEAVRAELEWLSCVTGMESILDGGLRDVENVTKIGEEDVDRVRCAVLRFESPALLRRFETSLAEAGVGGKPVKYEIRAWVTLRGEALISKIEDMWIHQEPGSGAYEYTISTRLLEPLPDLRIELP
jgi:hypothetical protein